MDDQAYHYAIEMMQDNDRFKTGRHSLMIQLKRFMRKAKAFAKHILFDDEGVYASEPSDGLIQKAAFYIKRFFRRAFRKALIIVVTILKPVTRILKEKIH